MYNLHLLSVLLLQVVITLVRKLLRHRWDENMDKRLDVGGMAQSSETEWRGTVVFWEKKTLQNIWVDVLSAK